MEWMFMPFRRYAEFSGRSQRQEYWMFTLFLFLVYIAFVVLAIALGASMFMGLGNGGGGALAAGGTMVVVFGLFGLFFLSIIIPAIAVAVRRLHDTDRSGWFVLLPLAAYPIQIIGGAIHSGLIGVIGSLVGLGLSILLLVWYCTDGTQGTNRFGPDPKGRVDASVFA